MMHFAYRIFLFVICFGILVHCQGARGGGGGGRGGHLIGRSVGRENHESCETHECRLHEAVVGAGITFTLSLAGVLICACILTCCHCSKTESIQKDHKIDKEKVCNIDPFQSGIWSSLYFQYGRYHGPYHFPLSFDSFSMKVIGSGSDDIGVFTIHGTYSPETNRIGLTKTYQLGTGNSLANLGHQLTIQLTWNRENNQFEGMWYIETSRYCDIGKFDLKFNKEMIQIESDSNGTFNIDSSYPELLNSYVTREDYLRLVSIINPLLKELKTCECCAFACLMPCVFLFLGVLTFGIFWRIYVNAPAVFYIMLEFVVPISITRKIYSINDSNIKFVTGKLESAVKTFSDEIFANPLINSSKWTIQVDDSPKCTLSIELLPSSQKDLINTKATTNSFTVQ